jgi:hypothetical protein
MSCERHAVWLAAQQLSAGCNDFWKQWLNVGEEFRMLFHQIRPLLSLLRKDGATSTMALCITSTIVGAKHWLYDQVAISDRSVTNAIVGQFGLIRIAPIPSPTLGLVTRTQTQSIRSFHRRLGHRCDLLQSFS